MTFAVTLLLALATTPFESKIDKAFAVIDSNDWSAAAAALDGAYAEEPAAFAANNLHYLRGRVAARLGDWRRAAEEFQRVGQNNPLYAPALWHAARSFVMLRDDDAAMHTLAVLPRNFPQQLKLQLAQEAGGALALKIFQNLSTREARYEQALALGDSAALWSLIREQNEDDVALQAARIVGRSAGTATDQMRIGEAFAGHRQFDEALPFYQQAAADPVYAAEARYRIARIHFQKEHYQLAIDHYRAIVKDFPGTDWEKDADYQIASCYWRLADYRSSEKAYLDYIRKYGSAGMRESATRNLVDVYRALGENQKAITTIDRALATRLSAATRQVLLFSKAKVLYTQERYSAALAIFQQLGQTRLRSAPGAATAEEVQYFQALSHSKLGHKTAARNIWERLARDEFSYYGQRSAEKLGRQTVRDSAPACSADRNSVVKAIEANVTRLRRPFRDEMDTATDVVSELMFLRLWDEAALWMQWSGARTEPRRAAEIAYLGGAYNRAISFANRLVKDGGTLPLLYPAGYARLICDAAATHKADPFWLHAIIWQESKYDPGVRSGAGARGLMQFIPETAHAVAATIGMPAFSVDRLYDPATSIQLGAAYWTSLMEQMQSPEMALAAYNGGPGNVERWRAKSSDPELFVSDIGFVETKRYVMLVFGARARYRQLAE